MKIVPHKTEHLIEVLALRLTEFHYFESLGFKGFTNADCSYEFNRVEK